MKQTLLATLLCITAFSAGAQETLKDVDLSNRHTTMEDLKAGQALIDAQNAASRIPASEAREFIKRLDATVKRGLTQLDNKQADPVQIRELAIDLSSLEAEGKKFGVLFTPFHKCNEAAVSAASSWQGLMFNDALQFENGFIEYEAAGAACERAAG
ncbi:hypothetical protein [Pseudomonas sp. C2B4]|uniref:hypothetical protein n=1 Tax=Pseudomonas sp. C2B4 TaxID=2735270 RepID=UPI0015868008|nr:hypothetical protein [Pseudomonas sp. C2B4]NUU36120.1 hypothetical protein [Pseudomonas sp. C2B4]